MLKAFMTGRVISDSVIRSGGGKTWLSFPLTCKYNSLGHTKRQKVNCLMYSEKRIFGLAKQVTRGRRVLVVGRPGANAWNNDKTGDAGASLLLFVQDLQFMDGEVARDPDKEEHNREYRSAGYGSAQR